MNGKAHASFQCRAALDGLHGEEEICGAFVVMPLFNDGCYTNFNTPEGWHIELSYDPNSFEATVVRCPQHCQFVGESLATGGHWEDFP